MPEVIVIGDATYYSHARLTPIGGLWEGTVEIVTSTARTVHVCGGVHEDADGALKEAFSNTVKLLQRHNRGGLSTGVRPS